MHTEVFLASNPLKQARKTCISFMFRVISVPALLDQTKKSMSHSDSADASRQGPTEDMLFLIKLLFPA